jgi:hypothetical protein
LAGLKRLGQYDREEIFSFVISVRQGVREKDKLQAGVWTRAMIDEKYDPEYRFKNKL